MGGRIMKISVNLLLLLTFLCSHGDMSAIDFKITSFRSLPNDVSAFISPVKDLNDEDCALVKVIASEDFAFSTPLGIVKRVDNVGEIWLYLPRKSKKITIKHPKYGVLRDYVFPDKIESHLTYELRIEEPHNAVYAADLQPGVVPVVTDTLFLTRTDTVVVEMPKDRVPFSVSAIATYTYGGNTGSSLGGIMLAAMRTHGAYLRVASDFGKGAKAGAVSDRYGYIGDNCPFYSGETRNIGFQVSAGAIHRLSSVFNIFEGIGYGSNRRYWQLAASEGGGFVRNSHYSFDGVIVEVGTTASFGRFIFAASVATIEGAQWYGSVGVGLKL